MTEYEEDDGESEIDVEIFKAKTEAMEQRAEEIMEHVEKKGLQNILDCTLDVMTTEEFGSGACLYHNYVCIIVYDMGSSSRIGIGVLHPADDKEKCPPFEPAGFAVPWDFDAKETAKSIRRLAQAANKLYKDLGIEIVPPLCDLQVPQTFIPDEEDLIN